MQIDMGRRGKSTLKGGGGVPKQMPVNILVGKKKVELLMGTALRLSSQGHLLAVPTVRTMTLLYR